jgi:alkylation response protein AidB-like acyl-CoA dehydrogenase/AcrR family transcriptional regulator
MSADFPAFALSEEHEAIREAVRALADDKIAPRAAEVDESAEFPWDVYEALAKADFAAAHIPAEYGGAGADAIATAIIIEEVARVCATSSLIPAVNKLGTVPLLLAGSAELKQRYLPPVAHGEAMFSYALSEPEAGSDAAAMSTRAVRNGENYILNGTKRWITNAGVSRYYTVMAVTDPSAGGSGISAFVVESDDPGFSFGAPEHKLGIKGSPTRELYFDDCAIPAGRLIGAEGSGFRIALATLDHTRITIAAQALGIAQGALDCATGYVKQRRQFGQPVADFQGVQFMLADAAMRVEAARQLTYAAAAKSERAMNGDRSSDLTFVSSAAKCFASDVAMDVTTDAVQLLGGYGYVKDYPVERMMRDAKITQIYEGTNQIQRVVMARQLLKYPGGPAQAGPARLAEVGSARAVTQGGPLTMETAGADAVASQGSLRRPAYRRSARSPRGEARRRELLDRVTNDLAVNGLVDFSLRRAARAAGTTHKVLLYHFDGADDLLRQAIWQLRERRISNALAAMQTADQPTLAARVRAVWPALVGEESRVLDQAIGLMMYDTNRYAELGRGASQQYLPALLALCPDSWSGERKVEVAELILAALRGFLIDRLTSGNTTGVQAGFEALARALDREEATAD